MGMSVLFPGHRGLFKRQQKDYIQREVNVRRNVDLEGKGAWLQHKKVALARHKRRHFILGGCQACREGLMSRTPSRMSARVGKKRPSKALSSNPLAQKVAQRESKKHAEDGRGTCVWPSLKLHLPLFAQSPCSQQVISILIGDFGTRKRLCCT